MKKLLLIIALSSTTAFAYKDKELHDKGVCFAAKASASNSCLREKALLIGSITKLNMGIVKLNNTKAA
jgi:hypothetical protein